jgi:hypothetical protein
MLDSRRHGDKRHGTGCKCNIIRRGETAQSKTRGSRSHKTRPRQLRSIAGGDVFIVDQIVERLLDVDIGGNDASLLQRDAGL